MRNSLCRSTIATSLIAGLLLTLSGCGNKPETGGQGNTVLPADTTGKMQNAYERNQKVQAAAKK